MKLDAYGYGGKMQDISIFPEIAKQVVESLTVEEQLSLRYELWTLMWIARIAMAEAL